MKTHFFFISFFFIYIGYAQTIVEKTVINPNLTFIEIDAANCFDILMETTKGDQMNVTARIDGQYQNDLELKVTEKGSTLHIGAGFNPDFNRPNDKLSAHKVVSIALQIKIPQGKRVVLNGTSCNVSIEGAYANVDISLNDGQCELKQVSANATVRTQSGDISVIGRNATITAQSKYGKVSQNGIPIGDNRYILKTVTGNIHFIKTE